MSFLLAGANRVNRPQTPASQLRIQSAVNGQPLPIVYGQNRLAGNLVWYGDFVATQQGGSGGKGPLASGSSKQASGSFVYQAAVDIALCEGPIDAILMGWNSKTPESLATLGFSTFDGPPGQAPWGYMTTYHPGQAIGYSDTAHVANGPIQLGSSPDLPNFTFEVRGAISCAVAETAAVSGSYNVTAQYFSLASSVAEIVQVPAGPPYQVQAQNPNAPASLPVLLGSITSASIIGSYSQGVVYQATGQPLTRVSGTPAQGQYNVASGGLYTFSAADAGQILLIVDLAVSPGVHYVQQPTGNTAVGSTTISSLSSVAGIVAGQIVTGAGIPPGSVVVSVGASSCVISQPATAAGTGVTLTFYGAALTQVLGAPGQGQSLAQGTFSVSVQPGSYGVYTFSAADAGAKMLIIDVPDADPSLVLSDFLTNLRYGCGLPSQFIGDLSALQNYAYALGLFISPVIASASPASSFLADFASGLNGEFVWTGGKLTFVPYGDSAATGNGKTYTPPAAAIYSLGDDDFLKNQGTASAGVSPYTSDDPVVCAIKRQSDQLNSIKIGFLNRGISYNPDIVEAKDDAAINVYGLRPADVKKLEFFCIEQAALLSAQLQLGRQQVLNRYTFTVPWYFVLLDPMDIIAITDANLGLNSQLVRILEISENQQDMSRTLVVEEYLGGAASSPIYGHQPKAGYLPNYNPDPGLINPPAIFEPPILLSGHAAVEVWMAVSGINTLLWGGCQVWLSSDGQTYKQVGKIQGPARQGVLSALLASVSPAALGAQTIDQADTLSVDLTESAGTLASGTTQNASGLDTACYVDGEYIAYATATLTAPNKYGLTYLVRGAYGSTIGAHQAGAQFARLDGQIFKLSVDPANIGRTLYIKFASFNIWGGGQQPLSECPAYTYQVQGSALLAPLANPSSLTSNFIDNLVQIRWSPVTDLRGPIDYEVRKGTSWQNSQVLGRTSLTSFPAYGNDTYWVAAHYKTPTGTDVYSATPQSIAINNASLPQNLVVTYDEAATGWSGVCTPGAYLLGGNIELAGAGDILTDPDVITTPDVIFYGGVASSGSYAPPSGHTITLPSVRNCLVTSNWTLQGSSITADILTVPDVLTMADFLQGNFTALVSAQVQVALSQDGVTFGAWQNFSPGVYQFMAIKFQILLASLRTDVTAILSAWSFRVDVPLRTDHQEGLSIASGGTAVTYLNAYPSGSAAPYVVAPNVTGVIVNPSAGDVLVISGQSATGFTAQVQNGGVGVAGRTINWLAQGY